MRCAVVFLCCALCVAFFVTPAVAKACCGINAFNNVRCGEKSSDDGCAMDERCFWSEKLERCPNGAVEEVTNGFIMLCSWVGMVAFALCYERGRRWARGMGSMWPAGNTPQGRWRHGLFACCGCSALCCSACCCAFPMASFNRAELERRQWQWSDLCCNLSPATVYMNRLTLQQKLDIAPSPCETCLTVCFCWSCAVGQHTLEIETGVPVPPQNVATATMGAGADIEMGGVSHPHAIPFDGKY